MRLGWLLALAFFCAGSAQAEQLVDLPTRGTTLRVLMDRPTEPVAAIVLLTGGSGILNLDERGAIRTGASGNQLVRTRHDYVRQGFAVVVPDVAADTREQSGWLLGPERAADLLAVLRYAQPLAPKVWFVGTSRAALSVGTFYGLQNEARPYGLVLTAAMLLPRNGGPSAVRHNGQSRITGPVLLLAHEKDSCRVTPPDDRLAFRQMLTAAARVDIVTLSGGAPEGYRPDPCEANHYHGFAGIDGEVVATISAWIRAN